MSYTDELAFVKKGIDTVEAITGQRGIGYNANWLRQYGKKRPKHSYRQCRNKVQ